MNTKHQEVLTHPEVYKPEVVAEAQAALQEEADPFAETEPGEDECESPEAGFASLLVNGGHSQDEADRIARHVKNHISR